MIELECMTSVILSNAGIPGTSQEETLLTVEGGYACVWWDFLKNVARV